MEDSKLLINFIINSKKEAKKYLKKYLYLQKDKQTEINE